MPKEEPVQEPNGVEIYKMMEASARHTSENEHLKEELKSAESENERLSKQVDDLNQQVNNHCYVPLIHRTLSVIFLYFLYVLM